MNGFAIFGVLAFVIASVLAGLFGSSRRRVAAIVLGGIALIAVYFAVIFVTATDSSACEDCGEYLGRWIDPIFFFFAGANAVAWLLGSVLGGAVRRLRSF